MTGIFQCSKFNPGMVWRRTLFVFLVSDLIWEINFLAFAVLDLIPTVRFSFEF